MKKKVLMSFVLLTLVGAIIFAQAPTLDKLKFGRLSVTSKDCHVEPANKQISGDVVIPATHFPENVPVILSSLTKFEGTAITSLTILGNTMQRIDGFKNCTSLTTVTLPASVTSIPSGAFQGCTSLTSVTFLGPAPRTGGTFSTREDTSFPGDLATKYIAGGPGTYTRSRGSDTWTKQAGGTAVCPTCGGTGVVHL